MAGAVIKTVDAAFWVALVRIWKTVNDGVPILKFLFGNIGSQAKPDHKTVVEIFRPLQGERPRYFRLIGNPDSSIVDRIRLQDMWFGIVDDEHKWRTILELRSDKSSEWEDLNGQ